MPDIKPMTLQELTQVRPGQNLWRVNPLNLEEGVIGPYRVVALTYSTDPERIHMLSIQVVTPAGKIRYMKSFDLTVPHSNMFTSLKDAETYLKQDLTCPPPASSPAEPAPASN